MSQSIKWRIFMEQNIEYEENIEAKPYFDKFISIWKEYPNAISSRVTTAVSVEKESDKWNEAIIAFERHFKFNPSECSELEITKIIKSTNRQASAKFSENSYEVSYYDEEFLVRFYPIVLDGASHSHFESPYSIGCRVVSETCLNLQFLKPLNATEEHFEYMKSSAFQTAATWLKGIDLSKTTRKTHSLINKESYVHSYRNVRENYGKGMVAGWTENSNPQKTIYEDCGIASYINELVKCELLPKPKKFVDIGCGNGLLVYLLNCIGFSGYGVDVRARKIWSTTLKDVDLRESPVNPQIVVQGDPHFDDGVDLLIGNHSDELTPWIPVMAAKMNANFFLLPCCPFNFFGKYVNDGSHFGPKRMVSQYESFFEWTVSVANRLGFEVKIDRLAIPSTKRLCIIGRVPEGGVCPSIDKTIHLLTEGKQFVARSKEIKITNCANIPDDDRERIAKKLFDYILNASKEVRNGWRCGGDVPLARLAAVLTEEDKKLMKDQDGGLQTFLRNHFQIFHVYQGTARLRDFRQPYVSRRRYENPNKLKEAMKSKAQCWMAHNHPDGCPVAPDECRYEH